MREKRFSRNINTLRVRKMTPNPNASKFVITDIDDNPRKLDFVCEKWKFQCKNMETKVNLIRI